MTAAQLDDMVLGYLGGDGDNLTERLVALRAPARRVWAAYRAAGTPAIDYSDRDVQSVYLLRYLPIHRCAAAQLFQAADRAWPSALSGRKSLRVVSLGCGPCAETLGLLDALPAHADRRPDLDVTGLDSAAWQDWATFAAREVAPRLGGASRVRLEFGQVGPDSVPSWHAAVREADVVVAQNVIGEHSHQPAWLDAFADGLAQAPAGALVVLSDRKAAACPAQCPKRSALSAVFVRLHSQRRLEWTPLPAGDVPTVSEPRDPRLRRLFDNSSGLMLTRRGPSWRAVLRLAEN